MNKKKYFTIILVILFTLTLISGLTPLTSPAYAAISPVKINCVGDSITLGVGTTGDLSYPNSYPSRLQLLLGTGTKVGKYGASGYTLMSKCDFPYILSGAFNPSKNSPDIVKNVKGLYYDYDANATLSHFIDNSEISDYAIDSSAICVISGLIKGVAADTFAPKSYATRAESAVIIDRIMGISIR